MQLGLSSTKLDSIEADYSKTESRVLELFSVYHGPRRQQRALHQGARKYESVCEIALAEKYKTGMFCREQGARTCSHEADSLAQRIKLHIMARATS